MKKATLLFPSYKQTHFYFLAILHTYKKNLFLKSQSYSGEKNMTSL